MGAEAPWHWVILGIVVIALFGYKKLPDAARAAGRSLRIFKTEIKGMTEDDKARTDAKAAAEQSKPVDEVQPTPTAPVEPTQPAATPTQTTPGAPPPAE
jgi:sec-independent protein translocase protein TatA